MLITGNLYSLPPVNVVRYKIAITLPKIAIPVTALVLAILSEPKLLKIC